ncbi:hypothetical protein T439DRAFT_383223 [Meredithblackwellia eburnea MCA 4105]
MSAVEDEAAEGAADAIPRPFSAHYSQGARTRLVFWQEHLARINTKDKKNWNRCSFTRLGKGADRGEHWADAQIQIGEKCYWACLDELDVFLASVEWRSRMARSGSAESSSYRESGGRTELGEQLPLLFKVQELAWAVVASDGRGSSRNRPRRRKQELNTLFSNAAIIETFDQTPKCPSCKKRAKWWNIVDDFRKCQECGYFESFWPSLEKVFEKYPDALAEIESSIPKIATHHLHARDIQRKRLEAARLMWL